MTASRSSWRSNQSMTDELFAYCPEHDRLFENESLMARYQAKAGGHD
ncbi:hypothetical protein BN903_55 [Halorubrum sp. AJ67]|nr:hypothetical protein BN903_55 [Halorubrum sp. AJ67]